jgi:hypothetical protein
LGEADVVSIRSEIGGSKQGFCSRRDDLIRAMEASRVYRWIPNNPDEPEFGQADTTEVFYKHPMGYWLNASSLDEIKRTVPHKYSLFQLVFVGKRLVGTKFGASLLHGALVNVYELLPLADTEYYLTEIKRGKVSSFNRSYFADVARERERRLFLDQTPVRIKTFSTFPGIRQLFPITHLPPNLTWRQWFTAHLLTLSTPLREELLDLQILVRHLNAPREGSKSLEKVIDTPIGSRPVLLMVLTYAVRIPRLAQVLSSSPSRSRPEQALGNSWYTGTKLGNTVELVLLDSPTPDSLPQSQSRRRRLYMEVEFETDSETKVWFTLGPGTYYTSRLAKRWEQLPQAQVVRIYGNFDNDPLFGGNDRFRVLALHLPPPPPTEPDRL